MSFLMPPETDAESDSSATLQHVLAFIDAYDADDGEAAAGIRGRRGRPKQTTAVKPRSHSYRIRDEMQRLRRETEELEATLAYLNSGIDRNYELRLMLLKALNSNAHQSKRWVASVLHEYRCRQESERTNRQLKALLAKQMRMIRASETAFGMFTNAEISLVFQSQRAMETQNSAMDEIQIMASLEDRLMKLQLNVDNVVNSTDAGSMSTQHNVDSDSSISLEYSSCSSIPFSIELAEAMLMKVYARKLAKRKAVALDQDSSNVTITKTKQFQHDEQDYKLAVKGRMRKIHQENRVIFMVSSLIFLPVEGLTCVEESIVVLSAPPSTVECHSNPVAEGGSLLINWHRSHAQHNDFPITLERDRRLSALKQRFISESSARDKHHVYKLKKWLREGKQ